MERAMKPILVYQGPVTMIGAMQVIAAAAQLVPLQPQSMTLMICSGGGDVAGGVAIYNFLKMMPFEVRTHAFGLCGSIAATMFLAGSNRTAAPGTLFTLHAATITEGARAGQVSENTDIISEPFSSVLGWDPQQIALYFGSADEKFLALGDAVRLGIVHGADMPVIAPDSLIVTVNPLVPTPINLTLGGVAATGSGASPVT